MTRFKLFIGLISPYWRSKEGLNGWALLVLTFVLTSLSTYASVYYAEWNGSFYNALESREYDKIINEVYKFIYILASMSIITVNRTYFLSWLKIHWREWMTRTYTAQWLKENRYYHVNRESHIDNIDQRISADISIFINETTSLFFSFADAVMTVGSFTVVLWSLSGTLDFSIYEHDFSITGYLVYGAVVYASLGFLAVRIVGKRFKFLSWQAEKVEADYRRHVMNITEHNEAIAFAKASKKEQGRLKDYFEAIYDNTKANMILNRRFNLYTLFYGQGMFLPPLFLILPKYLSGAIDLGGYMQIRIAFSQVVGSLSWFTNSYDTLMSWFATMDRVAQVHEAITENRPKHVDIIHNHKNLIVKKLELLTPDGESLLTVSDWNIARGERCYISSPSGSGKTSLIKTLVGLWPHARGSIEISDELLVISQRDYIPITTLSEAIAYPYQLSNITKADIKVALGNVGLGYLSARLNETDNWQQLLSGGERQRLKLAKCFLLKPNWLVLDEAFSAIDTDMAKTIVGLLDTQIPDLAMICIAHNEWVKDFFNKKLEFKGAV